MMDAASPRSRWRRATYAIDKPYDYLVPSGYGGTSARGLPGAWCPSGGATAPPEGMVLQLRQEVPAKPLQGHPPSAGSRSRC